MLLFPVIAPLSSCCPLPGIWLFDDEKKEVNTLRITRKLLVWGGGNTSANVGSRGRISG